MLEITGFDELLRQLDRIDDTLSRDAAAEVSKAMGLAVWARARELCPVGDPEHDPEAKPLRDTIGLVVRRYDGKALTLVGPEYPAGAHGHLVENGHDVVRNGKVVGRAAPKPFIRPALDETKDAQETAAREVMAQFVAELGI